MRPAVAPPFARASVSGGPVNKSESVVPVAVWATTNQKREWGQGASARAEFSEPAEHWWNVPHVPKKFGLMMMMMYLGLASD